MSQAPTNWTWLDRAIARVSPQAGAKRAYYRNVLASGGYEGGRASRLRKSMRDERSPNRIIDQSGRNLCAHARHLERNYDFARGVLRVLVRTMIGHRGVQFEPMPRRRDGKVHTDLADQILRVHQLWARRPEVTRTYTWSMAQRFGGRIWLRDGEFFTQLLQGMVPGLTHGSPVPFSLEMLEADLVPLDYDIPGERVRQGVQHNAWGAAIGYHVWREHPAEFLNFSATRDRTKFVPAARMLHPAIRDRLHQARGATVFASVINRLEDMKETGDYELAAAKLASAIAVQITRSDTGGVPGATGKADGTPRFPTAPAMVFEGSADEQINIVRSERPNNQLPAWLDYNMRGVARGVDAGKASISGHYDGNMAARRQELVETWESYRILRDDFTGAFVMPVTEAITATALAAGLIELPPDLDPLTLFDGDYYGPGMPWIDPQKEAAAELINVRSGFKSLTKVIRERGESPWRTLEQIRDERDYINQDLGLTLESDAAHVSRSGVTQARPAGSELPGGEGGNEGEDE